MIQATNLPETVSNGQPGELNDTANAYRALNALTAALTGNNPTDAAAILAALGGFSDDQIPAYFPAMIDRSVNNQPARTAGLRAGRAVIWVGGTGNPVNAVAGDITIDTAAAAPALSTLVFDGSLEGSALADGTAITNTNTPYSISSAGGGANIITITKTNPVTGTTSVRLVSADAGANCTLGLVIPGAPIATWSVLLDFTISKLPDVNNVICRGYNDTANTSTQSSFSTILTPAGSLIVQCGVGAAAGTELTLPAGSNISAGARWRLQLAGVVSSNTLSVKLDNGPGTTPLWSQTVTPAEGHEVTQISSGRFGWGNNDANSTMIGEMSVGSGAGFLAA